MKNIKPINRVLANQTSGTKKVANVHTKFFQQHQNSTTVSHINHLLNRVVRNEKNKTNIGFLYKHFGKLTLVRNLIL